MNSPKLCLIPGLVSAIISLPSYAADFRDDIGYTRLQAELGATLPTGAGVAVTQVEAVDPAGSTTYAPNSSGGQFVGKTFTYSPVNPTEFSQHATLAGEFFYGNTTSMASGITSIQAFEVNTWLNNLTTTTGRVVNHSWVGTGNTGAESISILKAVDRFVTQSLTTQVAAMPNGQVDEPLLNNAYNVIAVGLSNGSSGNSSVALSSDYPAGRVRPDLVVPMDYTSQAAPIVASAAALLVGTAHANPSLSHGQSSYSYGSTSGIAYNAERPETIRAILMAGANRSTNNLYSTGNISDWGSSGHLSANGLDNRYGAGQIDVHESFQILTAGEQESGTTIYGQGFDLKTGFGGASSRTASYNFTANSPDLNFSASLVWDVGISNNLQQTLTFHHLGLSLLDLTDNSSAVANSQSLLDNTQNLWVSLIENHQYSLVVTALDAGNFNQTYALAWNTTVPIPAGVWLFASALSGLGLFRKDKGRI